MYCIYGAHIVLYLYMQLLKLPCSAQCPSAHCDCRGHTRRHHPSQPVELSLHVAAYFLHLFGFQYQFQLLHLLLLSLHTPSLGLVGVQPSLRFFEAWIHRREPLGGARLVFPAPVIHDLSSLSAAAADLKLSRPAQSGIPRCHQLP